MEAAAVFLDRFPERGETGGHVGGLRSTSMCAFVAMTPMRVLRMSAEP